MAWTAFTPDKMDAVAAQLFQPLVLLINYTLLQYLLVFYGARRREPRVALLFAMGILGVVCLIPFASPDEHISSGLNDISESSCVVVFLIQIAIIGRDLNKKMKFKTVLALTRGAELLILIDLLSILFSVVCVASPDWLSDQHASLEDDIPNICENVTLIYIFVVRFFYIIQSFGWRELYRKRKTEVVWYTLFATHEFPFEILANASGLSWEAPQSLWHRVTLAGCLYLTAASKLRDRSSVRSRGESLGPQRPSRYTVKREATARRSSAHVCATTSADAAVTNPASGTVRKAMEDDD